MDTIDVSMTVTVPKAASAAELKEALRVAETAFQTAMGNTIDAEFGYDEAVAEYEECLDIDDDEEELDDEMDDIDDEDFDEDEEDDEYDNITSLSVDLTSMGHAEAIEELLGKKRSTQYHAAGNRIIFEIDPDDDDISAIEAKLGNSSDKVFGFAFA